MACILEYLVYLYDVMVLGMWDKQIPTQWLKFYVLSIYVLRPGDTNKWFKNFQALKKAEGYLRRYRPIEVFDLESFIQYVRKTFKNY